MKASWIGIGLFMVLWHSAVCSQAESLVLLESSVILRMGNLEWDEYSGAKAQATWETTFDWQGSEPATLQWTQYDVKQNWDVVLNEKKLGKLYQDENRLAVVIEIAAGDLKVGKNSLSIRPAGKGNDDVEIGPVVIQARSMQNYLNQAMLHITVADHERQKLTPARITLLREDGALAPHGLSSGRGIASRIGTIYTLSGTASVPLPAGKYQVYAGRGIEYSLARQNVEVKLGDDVRIDLSIERVVDTTGYAACDTHIHTLTHSGHGDASIEERMVTIAGEGIEFAIATDHNKYINFEEVAKELGARDFFTPVVGCEVTTPRGHFNVFPVADNAHPISHEEKNWSKLFGEIHKTPNVGVIILNHARDSHSGVRPFSIENHFAVQGENAVGWELGFNAMEVLNSAATQSNVMQLTQDWMALLNSGKKVTPIGCSDSHDVARHFVGQGRTYIRCDDSQADALKVDECISAIQTGRVSVSYGVFVRLIVGERFESGDLASVHQGKVIKAIVEAQAPQWIRAEQVQLYVNGELFEERTVEFKKVMAGKRVLQEVFEIPAADYDAHIVAVVTGPGVEGNYWRCAKPYQPISTSWVSRVFGCSGAVWLDRDGNGQRNPARDYAMALCANEGFDLVQGLIALEKFDRAVAIQFFSQLRERGIDLSTSDFVAAVKAANETVQDAYRTVLLEIRNHGLAR